MPYLGQLATCSTVPLELGWSATNSEHYDRMMADFGWYQLLDIDQATLDLALALQRALVRRGHHRGPGVADLILAATAAAHSAVVLHYDRDFELIGEVETRGLRTIGSSPAAALTDSQPEACADRCGSSGAGARSSGRVRTAAHRRLVPTGRACVLRRPGGRHRGAVRSAGAGQRGDVAVTRGDVALLGAHSGVGQQAPDGPLLGGRREQHDHTALPRSGGTTRAVQVVLAVLGRVDVQHQQHVVDVDAPRRDVGGDEHRHGTVAERSQCPIALRLGPAAVQGSGVDPHPAELLGQSLGAVFRAHEADRASGAGCDLGDDVELCGVRDAEQVVEHRVDRRRDIVERVDGRIGQVLVDEGRHVAVEGRRRTAAAVRRAGSCRAAGEQTGRKPRSAMWSASSSTVTSISPSEHNRRSIRSTRRPGVATSTSTPRARGP